MRWGLILTALAAWALAGAAAASCTAPGNGLPALTGRLVYQDLNGAGALYYYDFNGATTCTLPVLIPTAAWNLTNPTNPAFTPDGQAILFSAVKNDQRHIYYWGIGDELPVNLTNSMGNQRHDDPKLFWNSTTMTLTMIWKRADGIWTADFDRDASGTPFLSQAQQVLAGTGGTGSETSAPIYSPDGSHIYYFLGAVQPQRIMRFDPGHDPVDAFPGQDAHSYYYPVVDNVSGKFFYVGGPYTNPKTREKIFVFPNANQLSGAASEWNASDTDSDNSDPSSIDGDYFVFSRDRNGDGDNDYELYVGRLSTGQYWSLTPLNLNPVPDPLHPPSFTAASYTPIRPATTPYSLNQSNYRPTYGAAGGTGAAGCGRSGAC
jgi:Tol biopolymer transport system component